MESLCSLYQQWRILSGPGWIAEYDSENRIDRATLEQEISDYMMKFEQQEKDEIEALKSTSTDADGFKQVERKRRRRIAPAAGVKRAAEPKPIRTFSDFYKRMSDKENSLPQ